MRHKKIEETFHAITPKRSATSGVATPAINIGVTGSGGNFSGTFSQAGQEISQLQAAFAAQSEALKANTEALAKGSGSGTGTSIGDVAKTAAKSVLGGGIASVFPLFSAIAGLFGGGKSEPPPLVAYQMPAAVQIDSTISNLASAAQPGSTSGGSAAGNNGAASSDVSSQNSGSQSSALNFSPAVTVNVNAMDSQSFLDRSSDIADAVRQAVLNLHPLNSVLADL